MTARKYRMTLRREMEQVVEFGHDEVEDGDPVLHAACELADPSCWYSDGTDLDAVSISDDGGATWVNLGITEVMRYAHGATT